MTGEGHLVPNNTERWRHERRHRPAATEGRLVPNDTERWRHERRHRPVEFNSYAQQCASAAMRRGGEGGGGEDEQDEEEEEEERERERAKNEITTPSAGMKRNRSVPAAITGTDGSHRASRLHSQAVPQLNQRAQRCQNKQTNKQTNKKTSKRTKKNLCSRGLPCSGVFTFKKKEKKVLRFYGPSFGCN